MYGNVWIGVAITNIGDNGSVFSWRQKQAKDIEKLWTVVGIASARLQS